MKLYLFIFIVAALLYSVRAIYSGHAIYGDGNGYYAYAHALYFEKSLDFDPIYNHLSNFKGPKYTFSRVFWDTTEGPFGVRHNAWNIGTALFWLPSLAIIDTFIWLVQLPITKFSLVYEFGPGITGIILSLLGLFYLEKYLRYFYDQRLSRVIIVGVFLATNLIYYTALEPALSHQVSFFLISFLLYYSYNVVLSVRKISLIGFLCGLMIITRMSDVLILLPIFWQLGTQLLHMPNRKQTLLLSVAFGLSLLIGVAPQLITQYMMYGQLGHNPYFSGENGSFNFQFINLFNTFFSVHRSFFVWTPVMLLGLIGLVQAAVKSGSALARQFLVTFIIFWLVVSHWPGALSAGYGSRFFMSTIPFLTFGLAYLFQSVSLKKVMRVLSLFVIWNLLLLSQFFSEPDRLVKDQSLTYQNFLSGQFTAPYRVTTKILDRFF